MPWSSVAIATEAHQLWKLFADCITFLNRIFSVLAPRRDIYRDVELLRVFAQMLRCVERANGITGASPVTRIGCAICSDIHLENSAESVTRREADVFHDRLIILTLVG